MPVIGHVLEGAQSTMYWMGCTLGPPEEYDWTTQCGLISKLFCLHLHVDESNIKLCDADAPSVNLHTGRNTRNCCDCYRPTVNYFNRIVNIGCKLVENLFAEVVSMQTAGYFEQRRLGRVAKCHVRTAINHVFTTWPAALSFCFSRYRCGWPLIWVSYCGSTCQKPQWLVNLTAVLFHRPSTLFRRPDRHLGSQYFIIMKNHLCIPPFSGYTV